MIKGQASYTWCSQVYKGQHLWSQETEDFKVLMSDKASSVPMWITRDCVSRKEEKGGGGGQISKHF